MDSCKSTGVETSNHFPDVTKMVKLGSGAKRSIQDYMFTRYACYLIAQNGDSKKKIAFVQSYFTLQTRKQELIEDRMNLIARFDARDRLKESENQLSQNEYYLMVMIFSWNSKERLQSSMCCNSKYRCLRCSQCSKSVVIKEAGTKLVQNLMEKCNIADWSE